MKCCVIQPKYEVEFSESKTLFEEEIKLLESTDSSMDIIVLPEASDVPALAKTREDFGFALEKYNKVLLDKCSETAKRCNAIVFVNAYSKCENGAWRNTTNCFDRQGNLVYQYYKQHLTPGESSGSRPIDYRYSFESECDNIFELDGIRFAFLTCYDFYYYESFANIAKKDVDVIIGCSHQRSDTEEATEIINKFLCYNTNAYLLRSCVTLGEDSNTGGCSMIVSPKGEVLANLGMKVGLICADIDPKNKYYKPAGFGNADSAHWQYVEKGRRPMKYRPSGSAVSENDYTMEYPRLCAHRGYGKPENTMPSLATAISLGADEIEFDLRFTKDRKIVSIHDAKLERTSNGTGSVGDYTYEELLGFDFGGGVYPGLKISKFEEILQKFACHCVMNIHIKPIKGRPDYDPELLKEICNLVQKYDCQDHIYFMCGEDGVIAQIKRDYPWARTCLGGGNDFWGIVDRAIRLKADKVQLVKDNFNQEMIDKAHANNILCNVFWSDDIEEASKFLDMGIDTILTNNYLTLKQNLGDKIAKMKEEKYLKKVLGK